MSAATPAEGGENTPAGTPGGRPVGGRAAGRNNNNNNQPHARKEKFLGAHPNLQGKVFEARPTRSQLISNFNNVDTIIKAQIGADMEPEVLESLEKMTLSLPTEPVPVTTTNAAGEDVMSPVETMKFKSKYDNYLRQVDKVNKQLKQAYSIYLGQCDEDTKATLKEDSKYEAAFQTKDVIELRRMLANINHSYRSTEEPIKTIFQAKRDFMNLRQQKHQTVQDYYEKFIGLRDVNETLNTSFYDDLGLVDVICREDKLDKTALNDDEQAKILERGRERMMAIHFVLNADRERYGDIPGEFDRAYLTGTNRYPKTLQDAYSLLKGWNKGPPKKKAPFIKGMGTSFNVNEDGEALVTDGNKPKCGRCGRTGHTDEQCHARKHVDGTMLLTEFQVIEETGHEHVDGDGALDAGF